MTRTSRLATIFSIGSAMALTSLAHAQAPGLPPGPPGLPGGPRDIPGAGGAGGQNTGSGGNVNNANSFTGFGGPIGADTSDESIDSDPLPNTGGEPLFMVLGGMALACSAFVVRRKLA